MNLVVDTQSLKRITEPVKIWKIPRFSITRLVTDDIVNYKQVGKKTIVKGDLKLIDGTIQPTDR